MSEAFYLVDDSDLARVFRPAHPQKLRTVHSVTKALEDRLPSCWIARDDAELVRLIVPRSFPRADRRLLLLGHSHSAGLDLLRTLFPRVVVSRARGFLSPAELPEALTNERRQDLFIGVERVPNADILLVYRGDLSTLLVPFSVIRASPKGPDPDFDHPRIIDGGQTLALGRVEAAADGLLYELDAGYRRRARARSIAEDASFGASLRRLRLQRRLGRGDFRGVSAKTIARIERGEVARPQAATLTKIARRLGVEPEDIETY